MTIRRILFHSTNTIGLGHMARSTAIAVRLRERYNSTLPFMVIEGTDHGLFDYYSLPSLRFPDRRFITEGNGEGPCSRGDRERALSLMCHTVVESLKLSAAVFDLFPSPYFVNTIRNLNIPYCFCIREGKVARMATYFLQNDKILQDATALIVPHKPEDVAIPEKWRSKTYYVGQIVRPFTIPKHGPSEEIIITGGGGGFPDTVKFYNLAIKAFSLCHSRYPQLNALLVTGPLFSEWHMLELVSGVRVIPERWDLPECIYKARLTICQGGYNTVGEILNIGAEAICVPANRIFDDQFVRAANVSHLHQSFHFFNEHDPAKLAGLIESILSRPPLALSKNDSEGAQQAADIIANIAGAGPKLV